MDKNKLNRLRASRLLASLTLVAGLIGPVTAAQPAAAAPPAPTRPGGLGDFVYVDREDDSGAAGAKLCTDGADNDCTLRGAIEFVNGLGTVDNTIYFENDVDLIVVVSPLPAVTKAGTWIIGVGGVPKVDALAVAGGDVFTINGDDNQIFGLSIVNGPNSGGWADIRVIGGQGNIIGGNYLGMVAPTAGTAAGRGGPNAPTGGCTPSGVVDNSVYGVVVTGTVGASGAGNGTYIVGNTIVCHGSHGVAVFGSDYIYVGETLGGGSLGNYIGVTSSGAWLPNDGDGVAFLAQGSNGVRFGVIRDNTIAGNNGHGVSLVGTGVNNTVSTHNNIVRGNRIGLDAIGTLSNGGHGVRLVTGAFLNQIGGNSAAERNVISGNDMSGVFISGSNSNGVLGNYIGTNLSGSGSGFGNAVHGVSITSGDANIIGGIFLVLVLITAPNVISGNGGDGVYLIGSSAAASPAGASPANTFIVGNYIGTDASGAVDRGNTGSGVYIEDVVTGVITGNVVSGNGAYGISLLNTEQISITANRVGTNAAGMAALANALDGVALSAGSNNNRIGGEQAGSRNTISGNGLCGVDITGSTGNLVSHNTIGLDTAGTAALGNARDGVCLFNADNNDIGLGNLSYPQYIGGNGWRGVFMSGGSDNNHVGGSNLLGVEADWATPAGNGLGGVAIADGSGNEVFAHMVANNGGAGVSVTGNGSANNELLVNINRDNTGLPIDLGNDGFTPNDIGDGDTGPNGLLNYPEITAHAGSVVTGTACANCLVLFYDALGDPTAPGGGADFFISTVANGSGQWSYTLPGGRTAYDITLQARNAAGASSEMSPKIPGRLYLPLITR